MIPLDEAREIVLGRCGVLSAEPTDLDAASGLVAAETVTVTEPVPPFDNSAMDGFAVLAADTTGPPQRLRIVGTLAAGSAPEVPVGPGEAIRIMTGAPMPRGADAIVMVERTSVEGDVVTVEAEVPPSNHVRRVGDDLRVGDEVVAAGTTLTAAHLGLLATVGRRTVRVIRRARVGVFSTGDELVEGPEPLAPGQIRDSNRVTLRAMVRELGADPVDLGRIPDDEDAIADVVRRGVADCDALLSSGGVSMGDFDYVKVVLDRLGDMTWMQVAIRPAKPLAFGTIGDVPVFGLPGNPVSSMVSFELFARPGLRKMMGHTTLDRVRITARAVEDLHRRPDGKTHFVRVSCSRGPGGLQVRSAGGQGSHQLSAMAGANGLAVLVDGGGADAGTEVEVIPLVVDLV